LAWCGEATFLPHYWRTVRRPRLEVALRFGYLLETMRWIDAGSSTRSTSG